MEVSQVTLNQNRSLLSSLFHSPVSRDNKKLGLMHRSAAEAPIVSTLLFILDSPH